MGSRLARHRRQRGQAMIYMAIVLAVLAGIMYATYDLARLAAARIQSQNAADAAALAAASVKVSVHNTRTLAYAAMTGEATFARLKLAKAIAILGEQPPVPGQAYLAERDFKRYIDQAAVHLRKMHRLRAGLIAYNNWVAQAGPQIVADAARVAYAANIQGMNDNTGPGASANATNMHLMDSSQNLVENGGTFKSGQFIGGVNYPGEGAGPTGASGKTFVSVEPIYSPLGSGLLSLAGQQPLPSIAAAGLVPSKDLAKGDPRDGEVAIAGFGMPWYSPRLFQIGGIHGYPNEPLH